MEVGILLFLGLWGGTIKKCMKCNSLVRIGFLSDEVLFKEESERLLESEGIFKIIFNQQVRERKKDVK